MHDAVRAEATLNSERKTSLRSAVYRVLETASNGDALSKVVDILLVLLIVASVVAVILESMPSVSVKYAEAFFIFETVTVAVFSIEYFLRVWTCVENPQFIKGAGNALVARLRFMGSFHAVIDLLAILPFYLIMFGLFGNADMRFLRTVRLLRVLKLTRYSPALNMLIATMAENGRNLAAAFSILLTVMLLAASGIYYFERDAQPEDFGSIPAAMWWAFATLTTVGYGDVTPITVGGKVFGACITVVGLGMVALPTGILASGFAEQLRQRSDRFKASAESAWEDGVVTADERADLERLRRELGLGEHTASQILDAGMVKRAVSNPGAPNCPHCGGKLDQ